MGLLALAPGTAYGGADQSFSLTAHYFEERPPKIEGTQMDAGVAFGIRDKDDFYLLEENALHDILRLDRYIHGKRRDVREKLYRTHGNEWHTLRVNVQGETVEAIIDDHPVYRVSDLEDTSGGIGLYGRTSASSCFDDASVQINSVNALVPQLKVGG